MRNQLPMFPIYHTACGNFGTIQEAAKALGVVTARFDHTLVRRPGAGKQEGWKKEIYRLRSKDFIGGRYDRPTLFEEILAKPPYFPAGKHYAQLSGRKEVEDVEAFAIKALEELEGFIEIAWDPSLPHVVMFSSGYDSRLIGLMLRSLVDRLGSDWFGDVRFCCFQPEIDAAKKIYDHLGLPDSQWFPIDEAEPALDYYAECLDFNIVGATLSESERFWGGPLLVQRRLEADGFLDDRAQGLTALFSDEIQKWNRLKWDDVGYFAGCFFFDNPGVMPGRPDIEFLMPFVSFGWLKLLTEFYLPLPIDKFKLRMIAARDPDLAALPNYRFQIGPIREETGGHIHQQEISIDTAFQMEKDYRTSWYARTYGPKTLGYQNDQIFRYYDDHNSHYLKAAIYDHCLNNGVELLSRAVPDALS